MTSTGEVVIMRLMNMLSKSTSVANASQFSDRGRFAAHRREAGSHRFSAGLTNCAVPVRAGLPAIGCVAAPVTLVT
ncbi:hypothetical protein C1X75_22340 [Pseudomonas sp. FW305-17]|nr:hypothetical protein C1X75_22340 [Pseudomonas sp. FW305-17]PNB67444.1 hypothetical protein C1X76_14130 [Pseudomonas sp. FW305-127]